MSRPADLSTSARLLTAADPAWKRALGMPFIADVIADSIADETFARYLVLERQFVDVAARMLGASILRSPTRAALEGHLLTLSALVDDQYDYFDEAIGQVGSEIATVGPRAQAQAQALADRVIEVAETGSYAAVVACMLPSEKLYEVWCTQATRNPSSRNVIQRWVSMHAEPPFTTQVAFLTHEVDSLVVDSAQIMDLASLVTEVLDLEYQFHDAAYVTD